MPSKQSSAIDVLGSANLDPFNALPVELSPQSMEVLSHCKWFTYCIKW
jgi:hypothetical protein